MAPFSLVMLPFVVCLVLTILPFGSVYGTDAPRVPVPTIPTQPVGSGGGGGNQPTESAEPSGSVGGGNNQPTEPAATTPAVGSGGGGLLSGNSTSSHVGAQCDSVFTMEDCEQLGEACIWRQDACLAVTPVPTPPTSSASGHSSASSSGSGSRGSSDSSSSSSGAGGGAPPCDSFNTSFSCPDPRCDWQEESCMPAGSGGSDNVSQGGGVHESSHLVDCALLDDMACAERAADCEWVETPTGGACTALNSTTAVPHHQQSSSTTTAAPPSPASSSSSGHTSGPQQSIPSNQHHPETPTPSEDCTSFSLSICAAMSQCEVVSMVNGEACAARAHPASASASSEPALSGHASGRSSHGQGGASSYTTPSTSSDGGGDFPSSLSGSWQGALSSNSNAHSTADSHGPEGSEATLPSSWQHFSSNQQHGATSSEAGTTPRPGVGTFAPATPTPVCDTRLIAQLNRNEGTTFASDVLQLAVTTQLKPCVGAQLTVIPSSFRWQSLPETTAVSATTGAQLSVPANTLTAGTRYKFLCWPTYQNYSSPVAWVYMTVVAKPNQIVIVGGDRTVNSAAGFSVGAQVQDPSSPAVINGSDIVWSCAGLQGRCPDPLDRSMTGKTRTIDGPVPVGVYQLTATYKKGVNASVTITVQAAAVINVEILPSGVESHLASSALRVYATVTPPPTPEGGEPPTVTIQWSSGKVGDVIPGATSSSLYLSPAQISSYAEGETLTVTCTASTASGVTGSATTTIKLLLPLTSGVCTIRHADDTAATGGFIAGESSVKIATTGWGGSSSQQLLFNFGFLEKDQGSFQALTTMPQSEKVFQTLCPLVKTAKVYFMVIAVQNGRSVANTTCSIDVSYPTDLKALAKKQLLVMQQAADSNDPSAVLEAARVAADALNGTKGSMSAAEEGDIRTQVLSAMSKTFAGSSAGGEGSAGMTKEERASTVQLLTSVVGASTGANSNSTSSLLGTADQDNIKKLMSRLLDTGGGSDQLDTKSQAEDLLNIISSFKGDHAAVKANTQNLAKTAAKNLQVGEKQQDSNADFAMMAEKRPASDVTSRPITSGSTSVQLNSAVLAGIAGLGGNSEISVSTVEYTDPPVGLEGMSEGAEFASKATEIDLQADGQDASVRDLQEPILLRMKVSRAAAEKGVTCRYYNTSSSAWTTEGCKDGGFDLATYEKLCYVYHLSMFAVVTGGAAAKTGPAPGDENPPGTIGVGLIIGISVGSVILAGIALGFVMTRGKTDPNRGAARLEEGAGASGAAAREGQSPAENEKNAIPLLQVHSHAASPSESREVGDTL